MKIAAQCFFILIIFYSCSDKKNKKDEYFFSAISENVSADKTITLAPDEYVKWIENNDNGIKVAKKIGDFTYAALFKPYEYVALTELKKDSINKKNVQQKINECDGLQYFTFRISAENQKEELLKVNLNSEQDYYSRIEYFSFKMQNDLKLIDGKDTLDCALFHFERVFGLAPYATFVLGFPLTREEMKITESGKKNSYKNKTLLFEDRTFGAGNIYMTIKQENLNRIPELIIN